jgi:hypothetical protein
MSMKRYRYLGTVGIVVADKLPVEEGGTGAQVGFEPGEERDCPFVVEHPAFEEVTPKRQKDAPAPV